MTEVDSIEIRRAATGELEEIGALTVAAYVANGYLGPDDRYATELRAVPDRARHADVRVAVDAAGTLLGSVTLVEPGTKYAEMGRDGELEFRMLAVAEGARGRGVGEALTRTVLRRARELGRNRVVLCSLDAMRPAHRLYERVGFVRLTGRDWRPESGVRLLAYGYDMV